MPRLARLFLLSLAVVFCGPLLGSAPTARAGFVAGSIAAPPLPAEAIALPGFGPGSDLGETAGAGALGSSAGSDDLTFDRLPFPAPTERGGHLPQSFLPVAAGSGAGSAGGTTTGGPSGGGVGPMTATFPPASSAPREGPGVLLALQESSFLPPAFSSRLFRPPR